MKLITFDENLNKVAYPIYDSDFLLESYTAREEETIYLVMNSLKRIRTLIKDKETREFIESACIEKLQRVHCDEKVWRLNIEPKDRL